MYEKIIVAIDGSLSSLNALRQSLGIKDASVAVACIAPPYEGDLDVLDLGVIRTDIESLLKEPCDRAIAAAEELAELESVPIETICEVGKPYEGIVDIAKAKGCDLIVMGRRGFGSLERALMGSVTARVIGYSPIDVLVVPQDATLRWEKILVATDGSEYSKSAARRAMAIAKSFGAELKIVSAAEFALTSDALAPEVGAKMIDWARYCAADVAASAERMDIQAECVLREGKASSVILSVAEERKADVIVVGSHGRTGLQRLLMGSVTERVVGHAPCPVLVVKQQIDE